MGNTDEAHPAKTTALLDLPPQVLQLVLACSGSGAAAAACACSPLRAAFDSVLASPPMASRFLASRYCMATAIFYAHGLKELHPRLVRAPSRARQPRSLLLRWPAAEESCEDSATAAAEAAEAEAGAAVARVVEELLRMGASPRSTTLDGFVAGMFEVAVAKDSPYCSIYADVCAEIQHLVPGLPLSYTKRAVPVKLPTLLTALCRAELAAGSAAIRAARQRDREAREAQRAVAGAEAPAATAQPRASAADGGGAPYPSELDGAELEPTTATMAPEDAARRRALGGCLFAGQLYQRGLLLGPAPLHGFLKEMLTTTGGVLTAEETACLCKLLALVGEQMEEADHGGAKGFTVMYEYYDKMWYACDYHDSATQHVVQEMLYGAMARKAGRVLAGFRELTPNNYNLVKHQLLTVRVASTQMAEQLAEALVAKAVQESGEPELYGALCGDLCKAMAHFVSAGAPGRHAKPRHFFLERLQWLCCRQLRERDALFATVFLPAAAPASAPGTEPAAAAPAAPAAPATELPTAGGDGVGVARAGAGAGAGEAKPTGATDATAVADTATAADTADTTAAAAASGTAADTAAAALAAATEATALAAATAANTDDLERLRRTRRLAALAWRLRQEGLLVETESTLRASLQALLLDDNGPTGHQHGPTGRPGPAAVGLACKLLAMLGKEVSHAPRSAAAPSPGCVDATGLYSGRLQVLLSRPSLEPDARAAIQQVLDLRANGWVARSTATGMTSEPAAPAGPAAALKVLTGQ